MSPARTAFPYRVDRPSFNDVRSIAEHPGDLRDGVRHVSRHVVHLVAHRRGRLVAVHLAVQALHHLDDVAYRTLDVTSGDNTAAD